MARLLPTGKWRGFDNNGNPLAGGKVYTYQSGTTTPKTTYTDSTEAVANSNPVILDANGYADIWGSGTYRFVVKDANDVQIYTKDGIQNDDGATGAAGSIQIAVAGGTADAITANYTPDVTLADLTTVAFRATATNLTTTPTFSPDGLAATVITQDGGVAMGVGSIVAGGVYIISYNAGTAKWEMISQHTAFADNVSIVKGSSDASKAVRFEVDGLTTATTRVMTVPDRNILLAGIDDIKITVLQQIFSSSGVYTPSSTMRYCIVELVGGGGGGGGSVSADINSAGGGGGGGGYSRKSFAASDIGASKTVTIGAGGAAGAISNNGGAGGTTSLASLLSATGGAGGISAASGGAGGGVGGIGSGGNLNIAGGAGTIGSTTDSYGGTGGSSYFGGGGTGTVTGIGAAGGNYGGGGGGGGGASNIGGAGAAGVVIITEYCI